MALEYMGLPRIISYKPKLAWLYKPLYFSLAHLILLTMPRLAKKVFRLSVDERIVAYSFCHASIGSTYRKILDAGCHGSPLPVELAGLGHEVYGFDVLRYGFKHPNLTVLQGDICRMPFTDNCFDVVTAISTIEHIGLGRWGDPVWQGGDRDAVNEMKRVLTSGGRLIASVPFGIRTTVISGETALHRVYDYAELMELFEGLQITNLHYFKKTDEHWLPVTLEKAAEVEGEADVKAQAIIVAEKA